MGWMDDAKSRVSVSDAAARLGMEPGRKGWSPCPACAAPKRGRADSRAPVDVRPRSWLCYACGEGGTVIDLVAWRLTGAAWTPGDAVRDFFAGDVVELPRQAVHAAPPEAPRAPLAELGAVWAAAKASGCEAHADRWLASRDLAWSDECAVLHPRGALPAWARWAGRSWSDTDYRLLLRTFDRDGWSGIRARWIGDGPPPGPKSCAAFGVRSSGVLANDLWRRAMLGQARPGLVVVCEGEPDWLGALVEYPNAAVAGIVTGHWPRDLGPCIAPGAEVRVMTDDDDAGARYAYQIEASAPRAHVYWTGDGMVTR